MCHVLWESASVTSAAWAAVCRQIHTCCARLHSSVLDKLQHAWSHVMSILLRITHTALPSMVARELCVQKDDCICTRTCTRVSSVSFGFFVHYTKQLRLLQLRLQSLPSAFIALHVCHVVAVFHSGQGLLAMYRSKYPCCWSALLS